MMLLVLTVTGIALDLDTFAGERRYWQSRPGLLLSVYQMRYYSLRVVYVIAQVHAVISNLFKAIGPVSGDRIPSTLVRLRHRPKLRSTSARAESTHLSGSGRSSTRLQARRFPPRRPRPGRTRGPGGARFRCPSAALALKVTQSASRSGAQV